MTLRIFLASAIASGITSIPRTSAASFASQRPIVPTPQYASTIFSSPVNAAAFSLHYTKQRFALDSTGRTPRADNSNDKSPSVS